MQCQTGDFREFKTVAHAKAQQREKTTSKRRTLKSSEAKLLLPEFKQRVPGFTVSLQSKEVFEEILVDDGRLFLMNEKPFAVSKGSRLFPSLVNEEALKTLPWIVVDMGAIPHICNGADIMRPGIREIHGEFEKGAVLLVKDIKFGKPIGICVAEASSESIRAMRKGKAAQNVHYVGDCFWEALKSR